MIGYAINSAGNGWRMVAGQEDLLPGETWSETQPVLTRTLAQAFELGETAVQQAMDTFAGSWGYGNPPGAVGSITQALTYMNSTNPQWKAEATALNIWRDAVWAWSAAQQAAISANPALIADTIEEFISGMPAAPARPVI